VSAIYFLTIKMRKIYEANYKIDITTVAPALSVLKSFATTLTTNSSSIRSFLSQAPTRSF